MLSLSFTCPAAKSATSARAFTRTQIYNKQAPRPFQSPHRDVRVQALPVVPLATAAYAFGAFKLWSGFSRTTFDSEKKTQLAALWPFLFIASKSFRANFKRAISE